MGRERRCGHEVVVVVLAVQQIEAAVLSAAEQRDVLHRAVVVVGDSEDQVYLIELTPQMRGVAS